MSKNIIYTEEFSKENNFVNFFKLTLYKTTMEEKRIDFPLLIFFKFITKLRYIIHSKDQIIVLEKENADQRNNQL